MDSELIFVVLGLAAMLAGFVDAVVGGGGLIQIPALFTAFPHTSPAVLFGTNKLASIAGTASAAYQYSRRVSTPWEIALPGALAAFIGSWYGAKTVALLDPALLRPLILVLLCAVAVYTFRRKDFGADREGPIPVIHHALSKTLLIGGVIGFYDGFFGPGTGSFLIFAFIQMLGMSFLRASATAKLVNVSTNVAAIAYFAASVELMLGLAGVMAVCNLSGAVLGSRLAIRRGSGFVRKIFLGVVSVLILRMLFDLFA